MPLGFEVDAMILSSLGIFLLFWKCRFRFNNLRYLHVWVMSCVLDVFSGVWSQVALMELHKLWLHAFRRPSGLL